MKIKETPMANTGIKGKKAMRLTAETMEAGMTEFKSARDSTTELNGEVDWTNWGSYDYEKMDQEKDDVIVWVAGSLKNVFNDLVELCEDEDFKEELQKITTIAVSGQEEIGTYHIDFSLDGTTLLVCMNADAISSTQNKDRLKAVWE
ncbi:hypothetical protein MNBD_GAMMA08-2935 [hydrothermal vent metagenome]|uniref:Uncharacterized protein n=1 Tax=hydrothermal vent metagenome TaxID=652676 RepID=A0A3B0XG11_9ZZZZ